MKVTFLTGDRLYLRLLIEADVEGKYVSWFNDDEICRGNSHHVFPYSREAALKYIQQARETRDNLILAIVLNDGDLHIGNVALQGIHPINRSAEFAILIGDKSAWGKGYAKEAGILIIEHAFSALNLNRVSCGTYADNIQMVKLAVSLGMKEEGRRRSAAFKNGCYVDIAEFGVLRTEFMAAQTLK